MYFGFNLTSEYMIYTSREDWEKLVLHVVAKDLGHCHLSAEVPFCIIQLAHMRMV